jgi:group I intron endonuclease
MTNKSGIYKIENLINGKCYIGSASNFSKRWRNHKCLLSNNKHHSIHLQRAWNKYGQQNFKFEILLCCEKEELIEKEQIHINMIEPEYNICLIAGNSLGSKRSKETCKKLSFG